MLLPLRDNPPTNTSWPGKMVVAISSHRAQSRGYSSRMKPTASSKSAEVKSGWAPNFPSSPAFPVSTRIDVNPARRAVNMSEVVSPIIQERSSAILSSPTARSIRPIFGLRQLQAIFNAAISPQKPLSG